MHVSNEGKIYYHHDLSGLSQWEVPRLPKNWKEAEAVSGHTYYYNEITGVSTWHWPGRQHQKGMMQGSI